jgi:membrane-associated phospholipid phosphatase
MRWSLLRVWVASVALLLGWMEAPARAQVVHPWERLGANIEGSYAFPNLLFHVGAAVSTVPLVLWVDEPVQRFFQREDPMTDEAGFAALIAGAALPAAIPATLYFGGLLAGGDEVATAGAAAAQAVVMQLVVVHALKWLTDRAGPFPNGDPNEERWSGSVTRDSNSARDFDFNPFNLRWGIRWPSGHTAASFALASSLVAFYPDELWLALVGYPLAAGIGIGMVEGDYHWFSDIVAGALIGHVIGWTVGGEFRATYDGRKGKSPAVTHTRPQIRVSPSVEPLGFRVVGLLP